MSLILSLKEIIMVFSIIARAAGALALGLATNYAASAAKEKFLRENADLIKKAKLRNKKVKIREAFATASANGVKMSVDDEAWEQHTSVSSPAKATKVVLRDDLGFDIITAYVDGDNERVVRVLINNQPVCKMSHADVNHEKVLDMFADQRGDFIVGYNTNDKDKKEKNMESWESI